MTLTGEIAKVEGEVKAEAINVETQVKTEVIKAETKVKEAIKSVEAKIEGDKETAVKYATEARIAITAEENLGLTKMENEFLKGQMEIRRFTDQVKLINENYPKQVEALTKKYLINPATHAFNAIEGAFVRK